MGNKPIAYTSFVMSRERRAREILLQKMMPTMKSYGAAALILGLNESALHRLAADMGCGKHVAAKLFEWEAAQTKQQEVSNVPSSIK